MQSAVHWQDADSSANAVNEIFPEVMPEGHTKKRLEQRQKIKGFTDHQITKYKDTFPAVVREGWQRCTNTRQPQCRLWVT